MPYTFISSAELGSSGMCFVVVLFNLWPALDGSVVKKKRERIVGLGLRHHHPPSLITILFTIAIFRIAHYACSFKPPTFQLRFIRYSFGLSCLIIFFRCSSSPFFFSPLSPFRFLLSAGQTNRHPYTYCFSHSIAPLAPDGRQSPRANHAWAGLSQLGESCAGLG